MVVRGRLHQLPLKEGSVVALVSREAEDPETDNGWSLPSLGEAIDVWRGKTFELNGVKMGGKLYCYGIPQEYWYTVRGEWKLLNCVPVPSVEEML